MAELANGRLTAGLQWDDALAVKQGWSPTANRPQQRSTATPRLLDESADQHSPHLVVQECQESYALRLKESEPAWLADD